MAAIHNFAAQCGTSALVQVPVHSRNTTGPPFSSCNSRNICIAPTTGSWLGCQHNSSGHSFHQLRWWGREFRTSLLDPCTLQLFSVKSRVRQCQQQPVSVPQQRFACSAVRAHWSAGSEKPLECCRSPSCLTTRIVSAFSVVLCCKVCVPSPRASTSKDSKSHTYIRKSSVHAPVTANVARFPANAMLNFRRIPGVSSSPSACSLPSWARTNSVGPNQAHRAAATSGLEGFWITSLHPLVMTMRVVLQEHLEFCARHLPQAPRLVPDGSHCCQ